ncbi:MAG: hypothetical protein RDV48_10920 [Candidatus Eremiobacteraeota bacterium]|nr:hypothetical protein [Candidatus Eremiobacteraeota bacterium]
MKLLKIGISGVRGIVGETITPELVLNFACAFGTYLGEGPVLVGRDTRPSGPMLHEAAISALVSTGCDVLDLAVCPTPVLQFMVKRLGARGAISISAGHNGKDWNALTFINSEGTYLNTFQGDEVLDLYHLGQFAKVAVDGLGHARALDRSFSSYLDALCAFVDTDAISRAGLRAVIDCCNGAGAGLVDELGSRLGCEIIAVNNEPSGFFPHDPEPGIRNAQQVASIMGVLGAHAGFVTNSDVSRISLITSHKEALSEEYTFPFIAQAYLAKNPGAVVSTVMTSRMVEEVARSRGCPLFRSGVGQSSVAETMLIEDAVIGGEGSGGVAVTAFQPAFDGFLSIAMVLEAMALSGEPMAGLVGRLPQAYLVKDKIACPLPRAYSIVNEMPRLMPGDWRETGDGLRLDTETGWIHLRASATEPMVRIYVEDLSKERAQEKVDTIIHLFSPMVK